MSTLQADLIPSIYSLSWSQLEGLKRASFDDDFLPTLRQMIDERIQAFEVAAKAERAKFPIELH